MQPTSFTCSQCGAPLIPGSVQCQQCGLTFAAPVPPAGAQQYAPPAKKGMPVLAIIAIVGAVGCLPVIAIMAAILFPVFAQVRDKARITTSELNIRQVEYAAFQYMQDHEEKFPPMDTMDHFKAAVAPYIKDIDSEKKDLLFIEPGADVPYKLNAALDSKTLSDVEDPTKTEMVSEAEPHSGNRLVIGYVDGHQAVTGSDSSDTEESGHAEE
jgi:hypothetical protein